MISFLSDIEEEKHALLLEKGNIPSAIPSILKPKTEWTDSLSWIDDGYLALILRTKCTCGSINDSLTGIFHSEHRGTEKKKTALDLRRFQIPLERNYPIEITYHLIPICPSCLPSKGFSLP